MHHPTDEEVTEQSLATIGEHLGAINQELAAAPSWKRSTRWWNDRVGERQRLLRMKDGLLGKKAARY
jgi:hypothetical protein